MEDDLINDSGFELGMHARVEMVKHQCDLLCAELEATRLDLRKAHRGITRLIVMYCDSSTELTTLEIEHEWLRWTLSEMYGRDREKETSRTGYAYGDHPKREKH